MKHQNKLLNFSRTCIFWKAKYMIKVLWSLILQSLHLRHGSWCLNLVYKRTVLSSISVWFPDGYTQFSPSFDGNIKLITRFPQPGAQQLTRIDTFIVRVIVDTRSCCMPMKCSRRMVACGGSKPTSIAAPLSVATESFTSFNTVCLELLLYEKLWLHYDCKLTCFLLRT